MHRPTPPKVRSVTHRKKRKHRISKSEVWGKKKKDGLTAGTLCEGLGFWRTARRQRKASQNDAEGKSTFNMLKEMVMIEKRGKKE